MVIEYQRAKLTVCPSQHAEHNELRNHTLNIKACLEGKGCLQTFTPSLCSRPGIFRAWRVPCAFMYIAALWIVKNDRHSTFLS